MKKTDASSNAKNKTSRRRQAHGRKLLLGLLGLGFVALLIAGLWPKPVPVELAAVSRGPLTVSVFEEGQTRIRHRHTVSAPFAGHLNRVPWRAGARIEAGKTVLATLQAEGSGFLDPRSAAQAQAGLQAAQAAQELRQAELERVQALLELAEKEFARADTLHRTRAISEQDWDNAKNQAQVRVRERHAAEFALRVAGFEVEQARAALLQVTAPAEDAAAPLSILAPVNGYVLQVHEESARVVTSGTAIMEVGDPQDLEAEIELLSSDAVAVRPGADVSIEHWGGDRPLKGRVSLVERGGYTKISALGVEEQRVRVRVDFIDPVPEGKELGDRYRVEARIVTWHEDDVLQVPTGALFRRGNDWMVFVARDGRAIRHKVGIGRNNGIAAQVLDGLTERDQVILHPPDTLTEQTAVVAEHP